MIVDVSQLERAYGLALLSGDKSTQNGAVIVNNDLKVVYGINDIPDDVYKTEARRERPMKYFYTEHAERAAILKAAYYGVSLRGATMYCPWAACADCARAIILSGISTLVRHKDAMDKTFSDKWAEELAHGDEMFKEACVAVIDYDGPITRPQVLFHGEKW